MSIIILTATGEFHEVTGDADVVNKFASIKSSGKFVDGMVDSSSLFFKALMKVDDRFGDPEQVKLGLLYCWVAWFKKCIPTSSRFGPCYSGLA